MRIKNAYGFALRAGAVLAALGCFQVAQAQTTATAGDFQGFMSRVTGANTATVSIGGGGQLVVTKPSATLGGTSGWTTAANFGTGNTATGVRVGMTGATSIGGKSIPLTLSSPITRAALMDGMGIVVRNAARMAGPLGLALTVAALVDGMDTDKVRPNPNVAPGDDKGFLVKEKFGEWACDIPPAARSAWAVWVTQDDYTWSAGERRFGKPEVRDTPSGCQFGRLMTHTGIFTDIFEGYQTYPKKLNQQDRWVPANWDEARPAIEPMTTLPSDLLKKQLDFARRQAENNGIEPYKVDVGRPTITAPTPAPITETETTTRTEQTPAGPKTIQTTTTTTTETGITTDGDKVTVNPKTTTTTTTKTTNPDGSVTETSTTDQTTTTTDGQPETKPEDTPGLCDLYPDILACAKPELDTPDGDIPRTDREIDYQTEDVALNASGCPADRTMTLSTGQTIVAYDWAATCGQITTYVRPVVLAAAAFIALIILVPAVRSDL